MKNLARCATEDGNPANEKSVQSVIVQAPIEKLRTGFHFVGTPGIGSDIASTRQRPSRLKDIARSSENCGVRYAAIQELARGWKENPDMLPLLRDRALSDTDRSKMAEREGFGTWTS